MIQLVLISSIPNASLHHKLSGRVLATTFFGGGILFSTSICHPLIFNLLFYLMNKRLHEELSDRQIIYHLSYKVVQVLHVSTLGDSMNGKCAYNISISMRIYSMYRYHDGMIRRSGDSNKDTVSELLLVHVYTCKNHRNIHYYHLSYKVVQVIRISTLGDSMNGKDAYTMRIYSMYRFLDGRLCIRDPLLEILHVYEYKKYRQKYRQKYSNIRHYHLSCKVVQVICISTLRDSMYGKCAYIMSISIRIYSMFTYYDGVMRQSGDSARTDIHMYEIYRYHVGVTC